MSTVKIASVIKISDPYHGDYNGKPYTIYEAVCTGTVDGVPDNKINIKSGKEDVINGLAPGQTFDCERKDNKGFISYKIKGQMASGSATSSAGAPAENRDRSFALSYAKDIVVALIAADKLQADVITDSISISAAETTTAIADQFLGWMAKV